MNNTGDRHEFYEINCNALYENETFLQIFNGFLPVYVISKHIL